VIPYLVGFGLASGVALSARAAGLDRDRAFYPTVLIVVASYYVLFAIMSGSTSVVVAEIAGMLVFASAALLGFRFNPSLIAAALVAHGIFDALHGHFIVDAGVPAWWPAFCGSYDVMAGLCLAYIQSRASELPQIEALVRR
jgi:hypothetical protein